MSDSTRQPLFAEVALPVPMDQLFSYAVPDEMVDSLEVGAAVRVPFGPRKLLGIVLGLSADPPDFKKIRPLQEVLGEPWKLEAEQIAMGQWVGDYYAAPVGEAMALCLPPKPGTVARKPPWKASDKKAEEARIPNPAQAEALTTISAKMESEAGGTFLIHGITGSGKTEVYLQLIERALAAGGEALVLLPEIALTPQTLRRIERRFPGKVAPYHSRLSHGERCAVWEAAARGELPVVVGARSAVFLPRPRLALVIVDEEHEPAYKADTRPRYHARDLARWRAHHSGVVCVLGSATPSLESWSNAKAGRSTLLQLPARAGGESLPEVEICDRLGDGRPGEPVGPRLEACIEEVLAAGEQAILFHNRRGFARFLQCGSCAEVIGCEYCDISLTWHLSDEKLHCHYCGRRSARPRHCPSCGEGGLRPRGSGTERLELSLQNRFPEARILRVDQDSTSKKGELARLLKSFGKGEADLLLGTQMVAKGLHFPGVTLVGIIDADSGLHFPDFRAHERSFQLLTQVAGRSGRNRPGKVLVQTWDRDHRVLQRVLSHDVEGFLTEELEQRKALGYPPARRLLAISATAPEEKILDRALARLAVELKARLETGGPELLGPARAVVGKVNRRFRGQLLLKGSLDGTARTELVHLLAHLSAEIPGGRQLIWAIDVDPIHLL